MPFKLTDEMKRWAMEKAKEKLELKKTQLDKPNPNSSQSLSLTSSTTNLTSQQIQLINYDDFTDDILSKMTQIERKEGCTLFSSINSLEDLRKKKKILWKKDGTGKVLDLGEQFDVRTGYFWNYGEQNKLCVNVRISNNTVIEVPFSAFTPESQGKWDTLRAGAKLNFNYPGNDDDDRPPITEQDLEMVAIEEIELED